MEANVQLDDILLNVSPTSDPWYGPPVRPERPLLPFRLLPPLPPLLLLPPLPPAQPIPPMLQAPMLEPILPHLLALNDGPNLHRLSNMKSFLDRLELDLRAHDSKEAEINKRTLQLVEVMKLTSKTKLPLMAGQIVAGAAAVFGLALGTWIIISRGKKRGHARQWEREPQVSSETEAT